MYFNTHPTLLIVCLLAAAAVFTAVASIYSTVQSLRLSRTRRFCDLAEESDDTAALEAVSVVVYCQDEAEALERLLREIISQDYPAEMEIVVVNEGESPDVRDTVTMLQQIYPSIYLTHTPDGARNLSRKKLALTLGIKASRHDTVVLTTVGAHIRSNRWLRGLMRHFTPGGAVEVVIGFAAQTDDEDCLSGACCRAFDTVVGAARWLGSAISGHPFRASELNVAYRRDLFFRNKGFSRSLNLHYGDDDIFISEIATASNTAVELGGESIVGLLSHDYSHTLRRSAMRHIFTEGHIRRRPRLWASVAMFSVPAAFVCMVAAIASEPENGFIISIAAGEFIILFSSLVVGWRRALSALDMRLLGVSIFPFALTYSLRRGLLHLRARFIRQKRYTWD